jgi:hypothetical protein
MLGIITECHKMMMKGKVSAEVGLHAQALTFIQSLHIIGELQDYADICFPCKSNNLHFSNVNYHMKNQTPVANVVDMNFHNRINLHNSMKSF